MEQGGEHEPGCGSDEFAVEHTDDRCENGGGGECSRVQVLVDDVESAAGDRERQEHGDQRGRGPVGTRLGEAAAADAPAAQQHAVNREEVPCENDPSNRQLRGTNRSCDYFIENGGLQLHCEEIGVVREERGIDVMLDGGEVDLVVFGSGMIAGDEHGKGREQQQDQGIPK